MSHGVVKWFNNSKGYGFLTEDNGRDDIFAHFSSVEMDGYKSLKRGQHVAFDVIDGPKGLQAQHIRLNELSPQHAPH